VCVLDHSKKLAEKIRISGGGRCNFTNLHTKPENYLSANPNYCRSALARYTPQDFIAWLNKHDIGYHEKKLGQLFCDQGSMAVITMLKKECDTAGVRLLAPCSIATVDHMSPSPPQDTGERFHIQTDHGTFHPRSLVIASGGLSIPKIGATPFGYRIAQQFGIPVTKLKPGLVPLSFHPDDWSSYSDLAGVSLDAEVSYGRQTFREGILFTHRGLSGPAILQISSYWEPGQPLHINFMPGHDTLKLFLEQRDSRMLLSNFFAQYLPKRFIEKWCATLPKNILSGDKPLNQYSEKEIGALSAQLSNWKITPSGTLGYSKAEVTCGGVSTDALSSKTMEASQVPGLYFIGEVVDVTGQLGGYNFQWAWASGYAAGQHC
jgi:predicted Rossmann fold flavoprotein